MDEHQDPAVGMADSVCCLILRSILCNLSMVEWLRILLTKQLDDDFFTISSRLTLVKAVKLHGVGMKIKPVLCSQRKGNPICDSRRFYSRDYQYWAQHTSAQQAIVPCFSSSRKTLLPNFIYIYFQFQGARGYRGSQVCVFMCDPFSLRTEFDFLSYYPVNEIINKEGK